MSADRILGELEAIKSEPDFEFRLHALAEAWIDQEMGLEAVEPILWFMEAHPDIEYGVPGALVHLVERWYGKGYERLLLESFARRPTSHTAWMVNRLINGASDEATRARYEEAMESALAHPEADESTLDCVRGFLAPD